MSTTAQVLSMALSPIRATYDNGLTLLMLPTDELPVVAIEAYVPAGVLCEPPARAGVAQLTGRMLSEGTRRRSALAVARAIEATGGELVTGMHGAWLEVRTQDLDLGLRLLDECLFEPAFDAAVLARERQRQQDALLAERDSPQRLARLAFDELVYGRHPFHRPPAGYPKTVAKLSVADCQAHHARWWTPRRMIVAAAGQFDPDALVARVGATLGQRPAPAAPVVTVPRIQRQRGARRKRLVLDKRQCHIYLGHLGIRRRDPDYYRLQVLEQILGLGAGFTDRLSRILRDEQGLAYTVYATITSTAGIEPGTFHAYIGTAPEEAEAATRAIVAELQRIRDHDVGPDELEGARNYLTGSYVFGFETVRQRCQLLVHAERHGLWRDLAEYPQRIEAVTADEVRAAARRHLHPDRLSQVLAGPPDRRRTDD